MIFWICPECMEAVGVNQVRVEDMQGNVQCWHPECLNKVLQEALERRKRNARQSSSGQVVSKVP